MDLSTLSTEMILIAVSAVIIISFFFGELSRKTNVPSVLMLIIFGVICQSFIKIEPKTLKPILGLLGTVGLIMIVLEAALELELKREKYIPIAKAMAIALVGLLASTYIAAEILFYFYGGEGMSIEKAWIYATPLSILSSAIIIPSVSGLSSVKKEFHIYESTFSDILGILVFYYLIEPFKGAGNHDLSLIAYSGNTLLTIAVSFIASYVIILIFQTIKSHTKLFLLIAVLLLLYGVGKEMHLSALIVILIFGLVIANMKLFFKGPLGRWLHLEKANHIYEGLHIITMETAFVVRTFFFVIFGLSINLMSLNSMTVAIISGLIIASIYIIRYLMLRPSIGEDIVPQLYIAPRGLITILLFYKIPEAAKVEAFNSGILLFIIIGTSLIMTVAMIMDKQKTGKAIKKAEGQPIGYERWKAPTLTEVTDNQGDKH